MRRTMITGIRTILWATAWIISLSSVGFGGGEALPELQFAELRTMGVESPSDQKGYAGLLSGLVAGDLETIRVELMNAGQSPAVDVTVRFYEGSPASGKRYPIGEDIVLGVLHPGQMRMAYKVWDTLGKAGRNRIYIQIDPDNAIEERNEENNILSMDKTVYLLGDFNQDGRINVVDEDLLKAALGSQPGDPHWNPICDIWSEDLPIPDPPNFRAERDRIVSDHADHVVFSKLMDLDLQSPYAEISFEHADHVVFSDPGFEVGDEVRITARFPTVGIAEVGEIIVQFFNGLPDAGGPFIGESPISSAEGGIGVAEIVWDTDHVLGGDHDIVVRADPDHRKVESSETNNLMAARISLKHTGIHEPTDVPIPSAFELLQNVPNPFNTSTTIRFTVRETTTLLERKPTIQLTIYDLLGRPVRTLVYSSIESGTWSVSWDGKNDKGREVSSGVYLYRLTVEGESWSLSRNMVLVR